MNDFKFLTDIPVSFEIIGMLGKVFRLRGSNFRMLPNPTNDHWLKTTGPKASWKITRLMDVFQDRLLDHKTSEGYPENHQVSDICRQRKTISQIRSKDEDNDLTGKGDADLSIEMREEIHNALDDRTKFLLGLNKQAAVLSVVVAHLTEVMKILENPDSALNTIVQANANKEEPLIAYYFNQIRPLVIGNVDTNTNKLFTKEEKEQRNIIWISLIFRMLCWLLLHDFDKADVKIVPSDLKGSRMPIYIG